MFHSPGYVPLIPPILYEGLEHVEYRTPVPFSVQRFTPQDISSFSLSDKDKELTRVIRPFSPFHLMCNNHRTRCLSERKEEGRVVDSSEGRRYKMFYKVCTTGT